MKNKVLFIDSSDTTYDLVRNYMGFTDFSIVFCKELSLGFQKACDGEDYMAIVIDTYFKDQDVFGMLKKLNIVIKTPIFMITSGTKAEILQSYELGSYDVLYRPLNIDLLSAKLSEIIKRSKCKTSLAIEINDKTRQVSLGNSSVYFTKTEYNLFSYLVNHDNQVHDRKKLFDILWNRVYIVGDRALDTTVSKIRKKLGNEAYRIKTCRGIGYMFWSK